MVKVLVRYIFYVEEEWEDQYATKEHIEFYYNEGTSCGDNVLLKIKELVPVRYDCLCPIQRSEVIQINGKDV